MPAVLLSKVGRHFRENALKLNLFVAVLSLAFSGMAQAQTWKLKTSGGESITVTAEPVVQFPTAKLVVPLPASPAKQLYAVGYALPVCRSPVAKLMLVKPDPVVVSRAAPIATWFANRPRLIAVTQ